VSCSDTLPAPAAGIHCTQPRLTASTPNQQKQLDHRKDIYLVFRFLKFCKFRGVCGTQDKMFWKACLRLCLKETSVYSEFLFLSKTVALLDTLILVIIAF